MTDVTHILDDLNEKQQEAVMAPPGPLMVLAGAGTGKTSVLTRKIAWLVQVENNSPYHILAVTFTNKAAREMRTRVESLLGFSMNQLFIGTFHGLSNRILRRCWKEAGLKQNFEIIDSQDQKRIISEVLKTIKGLPEKINPGAAQWYINQKKDKGSRPSDIESQDQFEEYLVEIYKIYQKTCESRGLVDFSELLLRTVELIEHNQLVREDYQERFQQVLIDEFQDTSAIQFKWVTLLVGRHKNVTAVGDEDQSIYGWRGARAENMQLFRNEYKDTRLIRLEQNYRSTEHILKAANAVINRNSNRIGKTLWTDMGTGSQIRVIQSHDEMNEAQLIANEVKIWCEKDLDRSDIAVLYRTNAQSRVIEQVFHTNGISHIVFGGQRFFDRMEVKDALAYLRLLTDRNSNQAFSRIVNTPPRGLGSMTVEKITQYADEASISFWSAALELVHSKELRRNTRRSLKKFIDLINEMADEVSNLSLPDSIDMVISKSGLRSHYKMQPSELSASRVENLDELINASKDYVENAGLDSEENLIVNFLDAVTLDAGDRHDDTVKDDVKLMTLHTAKGLEFPIVFIVGFNEGSLPHANSTHEPHMLEEERRLCYVGMTRAKQQLYLSYSSFRQIRGELGYSVKSRFLGEIPDEYMQLGGVDVPQVDGGYDMKSVAEDQQLKAGTRVRHKQFGDGIVDQVQLQGKNSLVEVYFDRVGKKWLLVDMANLQVLG